MCFRWHDISNVVNHKRTFNIECTMPENSVGFTLSDADTGRYFWKLCVLQHTFYMKFEQNQKHTPEGNLNLFANVPEEPYDSRDNLNLYASDSHISSGGATITSWKNDSAVSSNVSLAASQQQLRAINQNWSNVNQHNSNWGLTADAGNGSNASLNNRAQSSSCLDLSNNNVSHERERLKALLPGYRPAPDYETAVHQKYCISETELHQQTPTNQVISNAVLSDPYLNVYSGSQPDVYRATSAADAFFGKQLQQQQFPDVTQTTNPMFQQGHSNGDLDRFTQQLNRFNKPPPPYAANRLSSTSTPDLALASHRALHGYLGTYVSGSSPDLVSTRTFINSQYIKHPSMLAGQSHIQTQHPITSMLPSGGISNGSNTFRYRYSQSHVPHGTYENLNFLEPPPHAANANSLHPPQPMQRTYDITQQQPPTAAYRKSSSQQHLPQQYAQQNGLIKSQQHLARNGSIEPIYENVPLPRTGESSSASIEMRDRTSSIQSAPGIMRFNQQRQFNAGSLNILNDQNLNLSGLNIHHDEADGTVVGTRNTPEILVHRSVSKTSSNPIHLPTQPQPQTHPQTPLPQPPQPDHHHAANTFAIPPPHSIRYASATPSETKSQSSLNYTLNTSDSMHSNSHQLNSSQSSAYTNITSTTDSGVSSSFSNGLRNSSLNNSSLTDADSSKAIKEKKKRRWGFFGGSKTSLIDKQKSATLGRNKDKASKSALALEEESNLRHRWSTGLPRGPSGPVPLPVTMSKEKLVRVLHNN